MSEEACFVCCVEAFAFNRFKVVPCQNVCIKCSMVAGTNLSSECEKQAPYWGVGIYGGRVRKI